MLLFRNCPKEPHSLFFAESIDVEGQCVAFASLPHLCVFGVECREIASVKFSVRVKAYGRKEAHLQSSVFKLSKDLIDSIHEEGIVAYTS